MLKALGSLISPSPRLKLVQWVYRENRARFHRRERRFGSRPLACPARTVTRCKSTESSQSRSRVPRDSTLGSDLPSNITRAGENLDRQRAQEELENTARHARQAYGESLPTRALDQETYNVYERFYGTPLQAGAPTPADGPNGAYEEEAQGDLLQEASDGRLEAVEYGRIDPNTEGGIKPALSRASQDDLQSLQSGTWPSLSGDKGDVEEPEQEVGSEYEEQESFVDMEQDASEYSTAEAIRAHPMTLNGRFATSPSTIRLPIDSFLKPTKLALSPFANDHIKTVAHNVFGGPGLPLSPATPRSGIPLGQRPIALDPGQSNMSEMEGNVYLAAVMPGVYASIMSTLVEIRKRLGSQWLDKLVNKEGGPRILDAGGSGVGVIAVREILRAEWERTRKSSGEEVSRGAENPPLGKATVLTGNAPLRKLASRLLQETSFIPRLPDYVHASDNSGPRKHFDIILAPHTLWPLREGYLRKHQVQNLWSLLSADGGILVVLEKGLPRGFELVAGARSLLLEKHIASPGDAYEELQDKKDDHFRKEPGMIVAPCTNHYSCPMYSIEGTSRGRKDYCHFEQRYTRPSYLQRILGAKDRNHDDVEFSYVAVQRGVDHRANDAEPNGVGILQGPTATDAAFSGHDAAFPSELSSAIRREDSVGSKTFQGLMQSTFPSHTTNAKPDVGAEAYPLSALSLPRLILPPLKRRGHVLLDVCTPSGKIERWIVPRSQGKQAFRDARKARWGDLWALGAKTRVPRKVKEGSGEEVSLNNGSVAKPRRKNRQ